MCCIRRFVLLVAIIVFIGSNFSFANEKYVQLNGVYLNGKALKLDVKPIIVNGRTMVPLRSICEALGTNIVWNEENKSVTVTKDNVLINLKVNDNKALVGTNEVNLDVCPKIINNRILVPLRFVAESLNYSVFMDENIININTPDYVKSNSRYKVMLNDINKDKYYAYIFSNNERNRVTTEETAYAGAASGDVIYSGTYSVGIQKIDDDKIEFQNINLFEADLNQGEFNASRNMVYGIESYGNGQPDILVVNQYGSSNGDIARLFFIKNGKLNQIQYKFNESTCAKDLFCRSIKCKDYMLFDTTAYDNTEGNWIYDTFKLDLDSSLFILQNEKIVPYGENK